MHIKSKYSWFKHIDFMLVDLFSLILAFLISYYLKFGSVCLGNTWLSLFTIVLLLNVVISLVMNPYSGIFRRSYYDEIIRSLFLCGYNLIISCVIFYLFKVGEKFSREMLLLMYIIYFGFSVCFKYVWKKLIVTGKIKTQATKTISMFVIAEKDTLEKVLHNVTAGDFQLYEIVGTCDETGVDTFVDYVIENNVSEVLIAINPSLIKSECYYKLVSNGIGIQINIETVVGFQTENQFISRAGIYKTLGLGNFSFTPKQIVSFGIKRLFDIGCGIMGMVILIPLTVIVKCAYLSKGDTTSIFYRQKRVGKNGKLINIYKFRSMVHNAGEILEELLKDESYRKEWEENQKFKNDPRITKVGQFLRKTSLDEFPQFINVLKGEMSLVGPRPLVEGELEMHDGLKLYQRVKPGITGWWGCNGRSNIDYRERLELEYYYVKNFSLYLDILCIFRTVLAVVKKDGAK